MATEDKKSLIQLVEFFALSMIASVVQFVVFGVLNYKLLVNLSDKEFNWFIFHYSPEERGLCNFIATAVSFFCAQITNFFIHRKITFKASNNVFLSAIEYFLMVILCYLYVLWLPSVISESVFRITGPELGPTVVLIIGQFTSALIQFPINKYLIMRN